MVSRGIVAQVVSRGADSRSASSPEQPERLVAIPGGEQLEGRQLQPPGLSRIIPVHALERIWSSEPGFSGAAP